MTTPQVAPFGSWKSPITSNLVATTAGGLGSVVPDGQDLYWFEMRPSEGGRNVIVRRTPAGVISNLTPASYNVRSRVHEYGGGAFTVAAGAIYFSNFADQRIYRQLPGGEPQPITPAEQLRYADGVLDLQRGRLLCVREDHTVEGREAVNTLVSIAADGSDAERVIVSGNDFYSNPRLSPDGSRLAWLTWNHPNMPWDGTELWVGELSADGSVAHSERIAGGPTESIYQPTWSPDNVLHFVSDRTGWWNLYRWQNGQAIALCPMEAEFGQQQWVFGTFTYSFASNDHIICTYLQQGISHIADLTISTRTLAEIETPYTSLGSPLALTSEHIVFVGASSKHPASLVQFERSTGHFEILRSAPKLEIDPDYLSTPQPIEFPTEHGLTAYGLFYPPCNRDYATVVPGELPPLLVMSHGGPTAATDSQLHLSIQYWTSRGIAVFDVNYGGSTGYGRAYRERLAGQWGIVDVDDCANGARYLVERGLVDGKRLLITGGSAGGYTTLCALTFRSTFKAGASYFGISDLETLARDTHKFESRYGDKLVGPYPERRDLYQQRSPINYTERLSCPIIFFQGLEDKVVPPNQAELMVQALRAKGLPVAYVPFEGEGHGFRRAENIKRSLESELYFYSRVFGFDLADPVEPVPIENL